MSVIEIKETKKLSHNKVKESKKFRGMTLETFGKPETKKEVEVEIPVLDEEKEMNEEWMKDELVALRSTVNVALQGSNKAQADVATVKQEMIHPVTGSRLWDGIRAEVDSKATVVQAQGAMDMKMLSDRVDELEQTVDQLMDLVQKLIEVKTEKKEEKDGSLDEILKIMKSIPKSPSTPTTPIHPRYGKAIFGGPYNDGLPTMSAAEKKNLKNANINII